MPCELFTTLYSPCSRLSSYDWTALHYASVSGNVDVIQLLIDRGVDVTARDKDGTCAALRAQWCGHATVVNYFAKLGNGFSNLVFVDVI